jgi:hypothetical protein
MRRLVPSRPIPPLPSCSMSVSIILALCEWVAFRAIALLQRSRGMNSITFSPLLSPAVHRLVEHFGSVAWPQHTVHIPLVAMTAVTGSASGELSDTFAFTIWLNKEAVIRALSAELDQCDYADALMQQQREVHLSEIGRDRLCAEREEAALVWRAHAQGDAIEHPSDERHGSVEHVAVITTGDKRQASEARP